MADQNNEDPLTRATQKSAKSARVRWPIVLRTMHYYASMCTCFLILFFALSGFVATHADWFLEGYEHETTYDIRSIETAADGAAGTDGEDGAVDLEFFCKSLLSTDAQAQVLDNDEGKLWYLVFDDDRAIRCVVHAAEGEVEVTSVQAFPDGAHTMEQRLAYIQKRNGGEVSHFHEDTEFHIHSCDLESVWFAAQVMIFADHGYYELSYESAPLVQVISDLHQGKHSNGFQTFLSDLTSILLAFVVITGACIGLQMKKKRRLGIIALLGSLLLTVILLWAR